MTKISDPPSFRPQTDEEKQLVQDFLDAAKTDQDRFIKILVELFKARRWDIVGTCPGGIRESDLKEVFTILKAQGVPEIIDEYVK